jgi:DNA-binding MarR family transcriptional regulator
MNVNPSSRERVNSVMLRGESTTPDTRRQKDIEEVTQLCSNHLLQIWSLIDKMLPEQLETISSGPKRGRSRSGQGTGLTTNFMMFLCTAGILERDGTLTMGELSRATSIPQSTTTRMVEWMVENGYVDRFQGAEDRRVVHIRLTDAGRELLLAAKAQLRQITTEFLVRLPAIQRAAVVLSMTDLTAAWQSVHEKLAANSDSLNSE